MAFISLNHYRASIPFHVSVRTHEAGKGLPGFIGGTGLRREAGPKRKGDLDPRQAHNGHLTFWIHGYNNPQVSISDTWLATAEALLYRGVPLDDVVAFYWPGDQWKSSIASAVAYSLQVGVAKASAARLFTYLTAPEVKRPLRLRFVAHSLGCLVTLETVRLLQESGCEQIGIEIEQILLMAAAVPQGLCDPDFGPYRRHPSSTHNDRVLHSISDTVLWFAFRLGQRFAELFEWAQTPPLDSWESRQAVGRDGGPLRRWSSKDAMPRFRHGDYWSDGLVHREMEMVMGRGVDRIEEAAPKTRAPISERRVDERAFATRETPRRREVTYMRA